MKQVVVASVCGVVLTLSAVVLVQDAGSQTRITTTRQLQVIGAAAGAQSNGAWLVDLQSNVIIFCERAKAGVDCHTSPIP